MKRTLIIVILLNTLSMFSQNSFDINAIRFDGNQGVFFARSKNIPEFLSKKSFFSEHKSDLKRFKSDTNYNNFSIFCKISGLKINKRFPKIDLFLGVGYRKSITSGIKFYNEMLNLTTSSLIFTNYDYVKTKYYKESEIISIKGKIIFWTSTNNYFSIGTGLVVDFGYEINSDYIKKQTKGIRNEFFISFRSFESIKITKYKTKNNFIFSGSIPLEFAFRFSKNQKSAWNRTKLILLFDYGFQKALVSEKGYFSTFFNSGIGLQIGI